MQIRIANRNDPEVLDGLENVFNQCAEDSELSYSSFDELKGHLDEIGVRDLIVSYHDSHLSGFMFYINSYVNPSFGQWSPSCFVRLVCIERASRNREMYEAFYEYLFYSFPEKLKYSSITIQGYKDQDSEHFDAMVKLGFKTIYTEENRGGITLYLGRKMSN
jgi:hypothetical protein